MEIVPEHELLHEGLKFICRDDTNDDDVVRSIFEGEYDVTRDQYEEGSVSLDMGAHIGAFAIWACTKFKNLNVLCVEPIPENRRLLVMNVRANQLEGRVICVQGAVGSSKKKMIDVHYVNPLYEQGKIHHFVGNAANMESCEHVITVPCISLEELLTQSTFIFGANKIWQMKLDCEGGEYPLIREASTECLKRIKWINGEFHYGEKGLRVPLESAGFHRHHINNRHDNVGLFMYENETFFGCM